MLVTFTSSTSGEILMFSDVARRLFQIIGKDCTARGVFTKEQLADTIEKLRLAASAKAGDPGMNTLPDQESGSASETGLAQRAYPLIELMERTGKEDGYVMWQAADDFFADPTAGS